MQHKLFGHQKEARFFCLSIWLSFFFCFVLGFFEEEMVLYFFPGMLFMDANIILLVILCFGWNINWFVS